MHAGHLETPNTSPKTLSRTKICPKIVKIQQCFPAIIEFVPRSVRSISDSQKRSRGTRIQAEVLPEFASAKNWE
jgi:hypothetical protein